MLPRGVCPYCKEEQILDYKNINELDNVSFFTKMEDALVSQSFYEIVKKSTCKYCGREFQFLLDLRETLAQY